MFLLGKTGQNLSLLQISAVETGEEVSAKAAANQLFASKIFEGYVDAEGTLKAVIKLHVCKYSANDWVNTKKSLLSAFRHECYKMS